MLKKLFRQIQAHSGIIRHIQELFSHIQAYLELCYSDIFKSAVQPEPWHIQNQKHIQNPTIFTAVVYSGPLYIQNAGIFRDMFRTLSHICDETFFTAIIIFTNYNYFRKTYHIEINILR